MRKAGNWLFLGLLSIVLCAGAQAANRNEILKVQPGTLSGSLINGKGLALTKTTLALFKDEKQIATVKTDKNGHFTFDAIESGEFELLAPGLPPMHLIASADAEVNTLTLIAPETTGHAMLALTQTQWIWVGGGAATVAVATPIVVANTGGGSSHHGTSGKVVEDR